MTLLEQVKQYSEALAQQHLLRLRRIADGHDGLVYFNSNDYLSLATNETIRAAYQKGYADYPSGSSGSMLLGGYHANHQAVEKAFAELLAVDKCVLFSSGYAANLAVTALLAKINTPCIIDKAVHASIYDGLSLAKVAYTRYLHNDLADLAAKLAKTQAPAVIITEGVFSMSGNQAPLNEMAHLCISSQAKLIVDEAHSFGIFGSSGEGMVALSGLTQDEVPLRIIPLGKAFAAQGAIVAGQEAWIEALLQAGRSVIYSTAMSPALSYGLLHTLAVVTDAHAQRQKLKQLIELFREQVKHSPLTWSNSATPIQHVYLGCPRIALAYQAKLERAGLICSAVRRPTVSKQHTGLRIVLNAAHESEHIKHLFNELQHLYEHKSN